mgnify:CR=1 FL=1
MNYSRIEQSVSIELLQEAKVVVVGAGGSHNLVLSCVRTGIKNMTVLDFDKVDDTNLVRQGYDQADIGKYKVDALEAKVKAINPETNYVGITKNFLDMTNSELDTIFKDADILLFLTDSFEAQSFGNLIALKYQKPALWAGWYAKSRTAELFFQIPNITPACFRCCASSRYEANKKEEVKISSNCNTIFHSELLDSIIGMTMLGILHRDTKHSDKEAHLFYKGLEVDGELNWNFMQFKAHPLGGNRLFDESFKDLGRRANNLVSCWQEVHAERKPQYSYDCPDCTPEN